MENIERGGPKKRNLYEKVLTIRMTDEQYEALEKDAKKYRVRVVDVIRWLIDEQYKLA